MKVAARVRESTYLDSLVGLRAELGSGFTTSVLPMMVVDSESRPVLLNAAAQRLFTLDHRPASAGRVQQLLLEAWPDGIANSLDARFERRRVAHETDLISPPGQRRRFEFVVEAIDSPTGDVWLMVQVLNNTKYRRQQLELAFSHIRYRQLAWELPDEAICIFDTDLRTLHVAAYSEPEATYDADARQQLTAILSPKTLEQLDMAFLAGWSTPATTFEYANPRQSRSVAVRIQPIVGPDGSALGFLAVSKALELDTRPQSNPHRGLVTVGTAAYDNRTGWAFDDDLLALWGVEQAEAATKIFLNTLVLEEDRANARAEWNEVLTRGGQCTVAYRIRHGHTGALVHLVGTLEAILDVGGQLFRARATHIDVTLNVAARDTARTIVADAANELTAEFGNPSKALTTSGSGLREVAQTLVDLATSTVGDGALLQILRPGTGEVELTCVAHRDPRKSGRLKNATNPEIMDSPVISIDGLQGARLLSTVSPESDQRAVIADLAQRVDSTVQFFIATALRHRGEVFGVLTVFRSRPATPYVQRDEEVVNAIIRRLKPALAEGRAIDLMQRERAQREAATERLREVASVHTELLGQLASAASRERTLLAEAVHNDPLQLIVAALLRIDLLHEGLMEDDGEELNQVARLLESSIEKLRNLIVGLIPPDLHDGLGGALLRLADGLFAGTVTTMGASGPMHVPLGATVANTGYQILREALMNVRKHASARTVFLRTQVGPDEVTIFLSDDGVGSATLDAGPGHFGLSMMRAQATAQGGRFAIDSSPGYGTQLQLTLPLGSDS